LSISIADATLARMDLAFDVARGRAAQADIYGVSTGLGPMVAFDVPSAARRDLQYNLIRSHAAGMGEFLSSELVRGLMLARLQSLTRNRSAVRGSVVAHIAQLMNAGIMPCVPRKGGVGASGDLVQLAHLGMLIIGEGQCQLNEQKLPANEAYAKAGLEPLRLEFRDALALLNGTSAMVSMGALACHYARRLFDCAISHSCILVEILDANQQAYAELLNDAKRHPAQIDVARRMREHLADGVRREVPRSGIQLQAPYSVRCAPQIIGPMYEALDFAERALADELNSASDNPVFDPATGEALHGGNFHGESVALALDVLKIAAVKCSLLMERQLNLLLNDAVNAKLPPFLNLGRLGIELGLQGAQFTATSTAAENQTLAFPASVHSIPSNKDNQDVVSMGANAAWLTMQTIDNSFDIAAILAVALSQAAEAAGAGERLSSTSGMLLAQRREIVPIFRSDVSLSQPLATMSRALKRNDWTR
jgi:histidine ammonia-lyase